MFWDFSNFKLRYLLIVAISNSQLVDALDVCRRRHSRCRHWCASYQAKDASLWLGYSSLGLGSNPSQVSSADLFMWADVVFPETHETTNR